MGPQPGAGDVGLAAPAVERTLVAVKPRGRKTRMLTTISFFFFAFFSQLTLTVAFIIAWSMSMVALFAISNPLII